MPGRLVLVEDDAALRALLETTLGRDGWQVSAHPNAEEALAAFDGDSPEVVLTDLNLGSLSGAELCAAIRERDPAVPVLVMTAFGSMTAAVQALRAGAYDFLLKPLDLGICRASLARALDHAQLRQEVRRLRRRVRGVEGFAELVGESAPMRDLFALLSRVADVNSSVLITGESGTGKELVARGLHQRSQRAGAPFVALNCAAMPEALLESELFGHLRGSFTDARRERKGLFAQARGGTLFLDEVGDLPLPLQPKLLRALQERKVRPVGSDQEVDVDVRVIAATHRDLDRLVREERFRQDLLYRLDVIQVDIPPLRDRGGDVLLLAQRFVEQQATQQGAPVTGVAPDAARKLLDYDWPGNVRELQNAIERAVVLARHDQIVAEDLPPRIRRHEARTHVLAVAGDPSAMLPLSEVERRYVLQVLQAVKGGRSEAAKVLGIDRKTLYRKLRDWGVGDESSD